MVKWGKRRQFASFCSCGVDGKQCSRLWYRVGEGSGRGGRSNYSLTSLSEYNRLFTTVIHSDAHRQQVVCVCIVTLIRSSVVFNAMPKPDRDGRSQHGLRSSSTPPPRIRLSKKKKQKVRSENCKGSPTPSIQYISRPNIMR